MRKFVDWLIAVVCAAGVVAFYVGAFYGLARMVCK